MKKKKAPVQVVFTAEEFKEKGFDGEIAKYMREHKNTAIVSDGSIIEFDTHTDWSAYAKALSDKRP